MRYVVAPDSFKGSAHAIDVAEAMRRGIEAVDREASVTVFPMADGGEGTEAALEWALKGELFAVEASDPFRRPLNTTMTKVNERTIVIESAKTIGLTLLTEEERDVERASSYGLGQVIRHALDAGYRSFIIGLGGSAVNDGGMGMLEALGVQWFDAAGRTLLGCGHTLRHIARSDFSKLDSRLTASTIVVATDVTNPLVGREGASAVYGPQKGATLDQIAMLDQALAKYATYCPYPQAQYEFGAGAAGGLGFAFAQIGAQFERGASFIARTMNIREAIETCDLVLTGEGMSDEQTLYGKAPMLIATYAQEANVPVVLLSGAVRHRDALRRQFDQIVALTDDVSMRESMERTVPLIEQQMKHIIRSRKEEMT